MKLFLLAIILLALAVVVCHSETTQKKRGPGSRRKKLLKTDSRGKTDEDSDFDPLQYAAITRCTACEDAVERIVNQSKVTPLGTTVKSMHKKNSEAAKLRRTKLARATELVESACDGEERGTHFKQHCQDAVGDLETKLVDMVVDYCSPDDLQTQEGVESAYKFGKDVLCQEICSYREEMANSMKQATKDMEEKAKADVARRHQLSLWEEVKLVLTEYWYLYAILSIVTVIGTMTYKLKTQPAGRRLKDD